MEKKKDDTNLPGRKANIEEQVAFEDLVSYPPGEDIYNRSTKVADADPESIGTKKAAIEINSKGEAKNEKDFKDDHSGDDLDVPGAELDDEQEGIGSEDEENNYYSVGGDNHNDLEEDKGE
jgi:hypothetical protein